MRTSYTATKSDELKMMRQAQQKLRSRFDLAISGLVVMACLVVLFGDTFGYLIVLLASLVLGFLRYSVSRSSLKKALDRTVVRYPHTQTIDITPQRVRIETPHSWVNIHAAAITSVIDHNGIASLNTPTTPLLYLSPACATPEVRQAIDEARTAAEPVEPISGGRFFSTYRPSVELVETVERHRAATGRGRTMPTSVITLGYWIVIAGAALSTATVRWELPWWTRGIAWAIAVLLVLTAGRRGDLFRRYEFWRNPPTAEVIRARLDEEGLTWQSDVKTLFFGWAVITQVEICGHLLVLHTPGGGLFFPTSGEEDLAAIGAFAIEQSQRHHIPVPVAPSAERSAPDPDNPFAAPSDEDDGAAWFPSPSNLLFWVLIFGMVIWITLNR